MKRLFGALMVLTLGLLAGSATAGGATFETYVGCDASTLSPPSHTCELGDSPGAFFSADEDTEYEVCVEFPNFEFLCAEEQFAEAEELYVNEITTTLTGEHFVVWFVEGVEVGSWAFDVNAPPTPAPAAAPPPVLPPTPTITPTISQACLKARSRVRALNGRLRNATSHKAKVGLRAKLRAARTAAKRAC